MYVFNHVDRDFMKVLPILFTIVFTIFKRLITGQAVLGVYST
jgi:hypothetical protein